MSGARHGVDVSRCPPELWNEARRWWADPTLGAAGFFGGRTPSPEEYSDAIHARMAEHLVVTAPEGDVLAFVGVYNLSLRNGTAELAITIGRGRATRRGVFGVACAIQWLFDEWPLRKVYGRCLEPAYRRIASGEGRWFRIEYVLPEHVLLDGDYVAEYVISADGSLIADRLLSKGIQRGSVCSRS